MQPTAGYGPPMPGYGAPPGGSYEFNTSENFTIAEVARYARLWGIISLVSGVLIFVVGVVVAAVGGAIAAATARNGSPPMSSAAIVAIGAALVPTALVNVVGGVFYLRSGASLRSVVDTQGDDIHLLTEAVRSLTLAFKIEAIAMAIGFGVGLVIGVAGNAARVH